MPVMITLNKIHEASLHNNICYEAFEAHEDLDMDTPFPLSNILEFNDLDGTLWCFKALPEHIEILKRFAIWCAREVQHLVTDESSINALDVAEHYLDGDATLEELKDAAHAAAAYYDARNPYPASWAAGAAIAAACGDIGSAVRAAFCAHYAANATTDVDMEQKQINKLREMLN